MEAQIRLALSHPRRTEIFGHLIRAKDGTSEEELAAEFGMGIRLVEYHLSVLHSADLIARLDDGQESEDTGHSYVAASSRF
jgi:DNA-binding transcriptional ArsR family regulator